MVVLMTSFIVLLALFVPRGIGFTHAVDELPNASSGILVVDVSGSISVKNKQLITDIFEEAVERDLHLGLVLFSGESYIVWGPNVPARESLENIKRYFATNERGFAARLPAWTVGAGTEMYQGLEDAIAAQVIMSERGVNDIPIVFISDLEDSDASKIQVLREFTRMEIEGSQIYIVYLRRGEDWYGDAVSADYRDVLGDDAFISDLSVLQPISGDTTRGDSQDEAAAPISDSVMWALAVTMLLLILLDAFFLTRLPAQTKTRKEE